MIKYRVKYDVLYSSPIWRVQKRRFLLWKNIRSFHAGRSDEKKAYHNAMVFANRLRKGQI